SPVIPKEANRIFVEQGPGQQEQHTPPDLPDSERPCQRNIACPGYKQGTQYTEQDGKKLLPFLHNPTPSLLKCLCCHAIYVFWTHLAAHAWGLWKLPLQNGWRVSSISISTPIIFTFQQNDL